MVHYIFITLLPPYIFSVYSYVNKRVCRKYAIEIVLRRFCPCYFSNFTFGFHGLLKNNSIDSWTSAEENLVVCALVRFSTWNMSQHVATGWPNVCNILPPAMLRSVTFKGCDRLAGACKYWANNVGICCVEMLLSFGRDFKFYIWLEQFHLKIVENNSLRLMSSLINRTCRSY